MGVSATHIESFVRIPAQCIESAYKAVRKLAEPEEDCSERHYKWVCNSEVLAAGDLQEALRAWRWAADFNEAGDLCGWEFTGEKQGSDESLFESIAPFVQAGSFVEMAFDDCYVRWEFDGKSAKHSFPGTFDSSRYKKPLEALRRAIAGIAYNEKEQDRPLLEQLMSDCDSAFVLQVAGNLFRLEAERYGVAVERVLCNGNNLDSTWAISCLASSVPRSISAKRALMHLLETGSASDVAYASIAVGRYGYQLRDALPLLKKHVENPDPYVRDHVLKAIRQIEVDCEKVE